MSDAIGPPFISVEDAARRVVALYLQDRIDMVLSDRFVFALGALAGAVDREAPDEYFT
jgi:hypothetical protein